MITAMLDCEKPIVCGLNGTAAGAGANLVFASDLVVASEHATIIELFAKRGLIPDGGAAQIGRSVASTNKVLSTLDVRLLLIALAGTADLLEDHGEVVERGCGCAVGRPAVEDKVLEEVCRAE